MVCLVHIPIASPFLLILNVITIASCLGSVEHPVELAMVVVERNGERICFGLMGMIMGFQRRSVI